MYWQSEKNLLNIDTSSTRPHNMVNLGLLIVEICWRVWGTPANFNGFRVLAALLHSTLVVGVSRTLRRWTEGTTYIRQGGHDVGHWAHILVISPIPSLSQLTTSETVCYFNATYPPNHSYLSSLRSACSAKIHTIFTHHQITWNKSTGSWHQSNVINTENQKQ